jgi:hypothetical protein
MVKAKDDAGRELDAEFSFAVHERTGELIVESRGGRDRNPDYAPLMELLLARLATASGVITGAQVASSATDHLPQSELQIGGERLDYPIQLQACRDLRELRLNIARAVRLVARQPGAAGGGNGEKRIKIFVETPEALTEDFLQFGKAPRTLPRQANGRLIAEVFQGLSKQHVLDALQALDGGREHRFGEQTTYELIHQGRAYPPKAVFGLAAGAMLGVDLGPGDFSAGEGQACFRILRDLGFTIRGYWALLCNPQQFDIVRAAAELDEGLWLLPQGDPRPGDRILIWKARGNESDRGIAALAEVLDEPSERAPDAASMKFFHEDLPERVRQFRMRYHALPSGPIWWSGDEADALGQLTVSRAQGNKLYKVSVDQWYTVLGMAGGWPGDHAFEDAAVAAAEDEHEKTAGGGQGFGGTAEFRKVVEMHAMSAARQHYERFGGVCTDTSANKPYDFVVELEGETFYIEVKGTTSAGESVFLTRNEVAHARGHAGRCHLFVLHGIQVHEVAGELQASGGEVRLLEPWSPEDQSLEALTYRYDLPPDIG